LLAAAPQARSRARSALRSPEIPIVLHEARRSVDI